MISKFVLGEVKPPTTHLVENSRLLCWGSANQSWIDIGHSLLSGQLPRDIRGCFAFIWFGPNRTVAAVDHIQSVPLFYSEISVSNIFSDLLKAQPSRQENHKLKVQIELLGGHSLSSETTDNQIQRILPGHFLISERGKPTTQTPFINFYETLEMRPSLVEDLQGAVEDSLRSLAGQDNALLLSAGTDSTTLAGVIRKLGLQGRFKFVHAHSPYQPLSEKRLVEQIAKDMGLDVVYSEVDFSGDIIERDSDRQYSFWIENPFSGKKLAVKNVGLENCRIFTGELGDQLFGGPKNPALLSYALQQPNLDSETIATMWINLSASYGRDCGLSTSLRILDLIDGDSVANSAYEELLNQLVKIFESLNDKSLANRLMRLNYLTKGPYRMWAYSQDTLDWAHPFASWELFQLAFALSPEQKFGVNGTPKKLLADLWGSYLTELPWRISKYGFGIPAASKLRHRGRIIEY